MPVSRPPSTAQNYVPASDYGFRPYTAPPPARARKNAPTAARQKQSTKGFNNRAPIKTPQKGQFRGFDPKRSMPGLQQNQPYKPPTPTRVPTTTPPANSIQPRTPNSVINNGIPQGIKNSIGGLIPSLVPAAKDFVDREFDRRFPNLAPVRQAADLANPLTLPRSLADHPLNPLNPFGRLWDWAPWNDKKQQRQQKKPIPNNNGEIPVVPTVEEEITFRYTIRATRFGVPFNQGTAGEYQATGKPIGFKIREFNWSSDAYEFHWTDAAGNLVRNVILYDLKPGIGIPQEFLGKDFVYYPLTQPGSGLQQTPTGEEWPSRQAGMDPIEIFPPLPSPQYEPIGNPSYPRNPQPDTHPSQTPKPTAPNTAPKPAPLPQPNIPQPQPIPQTQPAPNPQPDTQPFPDGIPRPDPKTGTPPNPAPRPGRVPSIQQRLEPGWNQQPQPTPQFQNTPWKEPEIIRLNSPLIGRPAPQVQPDPTPKDLQEQIKRVGEGVEESTRRGCQYKEDDLAIANVTRFTGLQGLTNTPQFAVVPVPVHEKLKDYIEIQSETLAKIQGQTDGLRGRIKSVLDRLQIMRILNIMGTIASLHNAAMLSRNLGQTLGDATSTMIKAIGRITGVMSPEESIDVNQLIGEAFNDFMKSALGEDVWNGTKENWTKANRILTSASQIVWTIRNIGDSARAIAEWTAENTGKIGNALKKFGVVGENAYPWMPERVTARTAFQKRLDDFRTGVDNLEDAASSLQSVAGESISIMDEANQIKEQWNEFDNNVKSAVPKVREENKPVKDAADDSKSQSKGKDVNPSDMEPPTDATT